MISAGAYPDFLWGEHGGSEISVGACRHPYMPYTVPVYCGRGGSMGDWASDWGISSQCPLNTPQISDNEVTEVNSGFGNFAVI